MISQLRSPGIELEQAIEDETRAQLVEHFSGDYSDRISDYVSNLLACEHYESRFHYLHSVIGPEVFNARSRILISGCGVGSEMIVARKFGFGPVHGIEVEDIWCRTTRSRLRCIPDMHTSYYDGDYLPYVDESFEVIASGHVIEHTRDPALYIRESLRVLTPGGFLSLEFPHRHHHIELHTGLLSFEWLPRPVRNSVLLVLSSRLAPLRPNAKSGYRRILRTRLQQISMRGIRHMLRKSGYAASILDVVRPAPGIIRCVIRKDMGEG